LLCYLLITFLLTDLVRQQNVDTSFIHLINCIGSVRKYSVRNFINFSAKCFIADVLRQPDVAYIFVNTNISVDAAACVTVSRWAAKTGRHNRCWYGIWRWKIPAFTRARSVTDTRTPRSS